VVTTPQTAVTGLPARWLYSVAAYVVAITLPSPFRRLSFLASTTVTHRGAEDELARWLGEEEITHAVEPVAGSTSNATPENSPTAPLHSRRTSSRTGAMMNSDLAFSY